MNQVDVFAHDVLIVPVHLGMHWCMAAIDFRNKSVCYYDSLGAPNNQCLTVIAVFSPLLRCITSVYLKLISKCSARLSG